MDVDPDTFCMTTMEFHRVEPEIFKLADSFVCGYIKGSMPDYRHADVKEWLISPSPFVDMADYVTLVCVLRAATLPFKTKVALLPFKMDFAAWFGLVVGMVASEMTQLLRIRRLMREYEGKLAESGFDGDVTEEVMKVVFLNFVTQQEEVEKSIRKLEAVVLKWDDYVLRGAGCGAVG